MMGERLEITCLLLLCDNIGKLSDTMPGCPADINYLSLVLATAFIAIFPPLHGLTYIYSLVIFTKHSIK